MSKKLKIAAMLSGGGTTLQNLIDEIDAGRLDVDIDIVISSKEGVKGLERASKHGIETAVVPSKDYFENGKPDWRAMSDAIDAVLLPRDVDLVCLCGFMCFYIIPEVLSNKVINIHPALIPSFCGHRMFGGHVHEAVVESGVKVSGCTVHFVNNEYDAGPIILQRTCEVFDTDSADDVAARVFKEECIAYPEAIRLLAANKISVDGKIVRIAK